jgi:hypothetical protein
MYRDELVKNFIQLQKIGAMAFLRGDTSVYFTV